VGRQWFVGGVQNRVGKTNKGREDLGGKERGFRERVENLRKGHEREREGGGGSCF